MNIQIVRKCKDIPVATDKTDALNTGTSNTVTLLFKKSHLRTQYKKIPIVSMYDEEGMYLPVSLKLTQIQSKIPSSLLSRWINANCSEKLLTLKDVCSTVEKVKDGVNKGWWFTNAEDSIYGLHRINVSEGGNTFRVTTIDDGLGMQSVLNILKELQIEVECVYNKETQKMEKILITGEGL